MTWEEVREIALSFPGVEEGTAYGTPAFRVRGKFLTRLRAEDASLVLLEVNSDEREHLITAEPGTFHYTPHYANYPAILARLETVHPGSLRNLLERRWRAVAPKKLIKAHDGS